MIHLQGDSGGPLTVVNVVNEEGAHVLVGIVSKRLGDSCDQQNYSVYTSVSGLLPWIKSSIKENGGMASCNSFSISALPTLGIILHFMSFDLKKWLALPIVIGRYGYRSSFGANKCQYPKLGK